VAGPSPSRGSGASTLAAAAVVRRRGVTGVGDERSEAPVVGAQPSCDGGAPAAAAAASGLLGPSGLGRADSRAAAIGKRGGAWC
jgi:hypothetical protein